MSDVCDGNWDGGCRGCGFAFAGVMAGVPDPRRAQGQLYKLPYVLLFAILAIVTGCNSRRGVERKRSPGIVTFIAVHRRRLNTTFSFHWKRAPAHTAIRYILQGLDPAEVEGAFGHHAALLQAARATPGQGGIALDGKTLRGSVEPRGSPGIAKKSNEIPAAQALLAELDIADGTIVTLDALHCQKNMSKLQQRPTSP